MKASSAAAPRRANGGANLPTIAVRCRGAAVVNLEELVPIQGELKSLSTENFGKLKASILKYGITFPFFVWRQKNKLNILDGTQRDRVLIKMKEEGYGIPKLPIDYIEAANLKEAKEKILLISSQYGRMNNDSVEKYLLDTEIDVAAIKPYVELPHVDFSRFEAEATESVNGKDQSSLADETWAILIECANEKEQGKLLVNLSKQGLKCRALVS